MKRVMVCLGILFAVVTTGYAQDSSSDTLNRVGQTAPDDNSKTPDRQATVEPSKQNEQTSGRETHVRLGGFVVSAGYAHFWPGIYPYGFPYSPFYSPISSALWWDPF